MKNTYISRQRGLALIMAVLIAALAVSAIAFAAWRQQVRIRDAEMRTDSAEAQLLLRASITIARTALMDDLRNDLQNGGTPVDDPNEELFTHREDTDVEKGHASGFIEDANGRFSLNELLIVQGNANIASLYRLAAYRELLRQLGLDMALADTLADWIDSDDQPMTNGAEEMAYLAGNPPYRPANRPLTELSELLDVKGYTPEIVEKLRPFVDVLPYSPVATRSARSGSSSPSAINVHFCSPELLSAFFTGLSLADATDLIKKGQQKPYQNYQDFVNRLSRAQKESLTNTPLGNELQQILSVDSSYFYANLKMDYGAVHWSERVLLRRIDPDNTEVVKRRRLAD